MAYIAFRLVVTSLLVYLFGLFGLVVPPTLLATEISPNLGLSVEVVHASVHAIIKNWPTFLKTHIAILRLHGLIKFTGYQRLIFTHQEQVLIKAWNDNFALIVDEGIRFPKTTHSMVPVHTVYQALRCPLPDHRLKFDSHLTNSNLLDDTHPYHYVTRHGYLALRLI